MRRYSNPLRTLGELGDLLASEPHRNAIEAANLPPAQQQRLLRSEEVALLIQDYTCGASVEEPIMAFGVNRTTVYAHLDRSNVQRLTGVGKLRLSKCAAPPSCAGAATPCLP